MHAWQNLGTHMQFGDSTFIVKYLERTFFDKHGNRRGPIVRGNACLMKVAQDGAPSAEPAASWTRGYAERERARITEREERPQNCAAVESCTAELADPEAA